MSEAKTQPTDASVPEFLAALPDAQMRADCQTLVEIMSAVTKAKPVLWGPNIVGFGTYRYVYATGRAGDWPLTAFSPRKGYFSIYIMSGFEAHPEMEQLGKYKTGKCCLYVKRLSDVHLPALKKIIRESVKLTEKWQGCVPPQQQQAAKKRAVKPARGASQGR